MLDAGCELRVARIYRPVFGIRRSVFGVQRSGFGSTGMGQSAWGRVHGAWGFEKDDMKSVVLVSVLCPLSSEF